jgi:hypothetical protein
MNIDLAALPDDVETLHALVRSLGAERASLTEARAEIERLRLVIRSCSAASSAGARAAR